MDDAKLVEVEDRDSKLVAQLLYSRLRQLEASLLDVVKKILA